MRKELSAGELADLEHAYSYQTPTSEQIELFNEVRLAAKAFERAVLECCPASADRTFACRQIRDARMTANRSIALHKG